MRSRPRRPGELHVSTLTGPDRVVIDVSHVTSGHQPGRAPDGVMPYRRRNVRLKYDRSPNPASWAIELTVRAAKRGLRSLR
jgi:hypothetical protein